MKYSYPEMRFVFRAYFTQDFSLDYRNLHDAIDDIISDYEQSDRFGPLLEEIRMALYNEENLGREFFEKVGVDTVPCDSNAEGIEFFRYFLGKSISAT